MLSKCANPTCPNEFRRFSEGRVFELRFEDVRPVMGSAQSLAPVKAAPGEGSHKLEHFWLCPRCSSTLTIAMDPARNVRLIPRSPRKVHSAIAS